MAWTISGKRITATPATPVVCGTGLVRGLTITADSANGANLIFVQSVSTASVLHTRLGPNGQLQVVGNEEIDLSKLYIDGSGGSPVANLSWLQPV